jgi:Flp pilus assembly protein TadD
MDHWSILARSQKAPEAGWLQQVLSVADSDPWRQGVRAAREKNDRQEMEKLAREVDTAVQPPEALFVLEMGLRQRGATEAALALLRHAQQDFPGDFWINHELGMALGHCHPPQNEEALRFLTVAAALRPDSAGVRLNLGLAYAGTGRFDEAIVAYRKAIGFKPDYSRAHLHLGRALAETGHLDEAVAACRRASQLKPDFGNAHYELGNVLVRMDRVEEALAAYRRAIDLMPDHAESHCNLGIAHWKQGEYTQALVALKRGHELGLRRKDWGYPSAEWVRQCRRRIELDGRLAAVLRGEAQPADAAERNEYGDLCYEKQRYLAAARFYSQGPTADPKPADGLEVSYRFRAACAAARAGCGQGVDAGQLDDKERVRWRKQAREYLRADLKAYGELLPVSDPKERQRLQKCLRSWQSEQAFAGLRDATTVAHLSAAERESCKQLWAEVQALLAK